MNGLRFALSNTLPLRSQYCSRKRAVHFLVQRVVRNGTSMPLCHLKRRDAQNILHQRECLAESSHTEMHVSRFGDDELVSRITCLVLIILRNAPIDVMRVTMCALPVAQSVTVITGQENVRNSSKDSKNTPHDLSYLKGIKFRINVRIAPSSVGRAYHGTLCNWKYPI